MSRFLSIGLASAALASAHGATAQETIAYGSGPAPSYLDMTPAKAGLIGGMLGAVVMLESGKTLIRKNGVADPAVALASGVARDLADRRGAVLSEQPIATEGRFKAKPLAAAAPGARYVVAVNTTAWSHMYRPLHWNSYVVGYSAKMVVVDVQAGKAVLEDGCGWGTGKAEGISRDDLVKDGAALLKDKMALATAHCLAQFSRALDRLDGPMAAPQTIARRDTPIAAPAPVEPPPAEAHLPPPEPIPPPPAPAMVAALPEPPARPEPRLPPPAPVLAGALPERLPPPEPARASPVRQAQISHADVAATGATEMAIRPPSAPSLPVYASYPEPTPLPDFRPQAPPPIRRHAAGRDASGYLTWPSKRP
ncbi:hypothetical protein [Caulobacter segnis]